MGTGKEIRIDTSRYLSEFNRRAGAAGEQFEWIRDDMTLAEPDPGEIKIPQAYAEKYGLKPSDLQDGIVWRFSGTLLEKIRKIQKDMEIARRAGVREALDEKYIRPAVLRFDVGRLSKPSQEALPHLAVINRATDELQMLFRDPHMLEYERMIHGEAVSGYIDSARLFARQAELGCSPYFDDPACDVVAILPKADPNTLMWPDDFTEDEVKALESSDNPDKGMLLSHFTFVERDGKGGYKAVSYNEHPVMKSRLDVIAGEFEAIAAIPGIHESISRTAAAYAKAIREGRPTAENHYNPFETAEAVWAANFGGDLGFTWGPFEEDDPYYKKRGFQFIAFAPRQNLMGRLQSYQGALQDLENETARRIPGYKARHMAMNSVLHVSDVIMRAGDMHFSGAENLAHVLPNDGPLIEQGSPRREIFANIHDAKAKFILERLAEISLVAEQTGLFDPVMFAVESALHEMAHTAGPRSEHEVTGPDGKAITAVTMMGAELYGAIEESKANIGGICMQKFLRARNLISQDEITRGYVTYVTGLLRQIRFGKKSPHGAGAKAELGYLFAKKGVKIARGSDGKPRILVNLEKMPAIAESMYRDITLAQQAGSASAAKNFLANPENIPDDIGELIKLYAEASPPIPRDVALEVRFMNDPYGLSDIAAGTN